MKLSLIQLPLDLPPLPWFSTSTLVLFAFMEQELLSGSRSFGASSYSSSSFASGIPRMNSLISFSWFSSTAFERSMSAYYPLNIGR